MEDSADLLAELAAKVDDGDVDGAKESLSRLKVGNTAAKTCYKCS